MSDTCGVLLKITSRQGDHVTVQEMKGEAILKGQTVYIKYTEAQQVDDVPVQATRTLIKIAPGELKIMRHGGVESEQTFQEGRRLPGFYRSPYTSFNLSTDTHMLYTAMKGAIGEVAWEYDLYAYEEMTGNFAISLHIQEET